MVLEKKATKKEYPVHPMERRSQSTLDASKMNGTRDGK